MIHTHIQTHTHGGPILNHKKEEILPILSTWMALKDIMLSEVSQTAEDKLCVFSFICGV